MTTRAWEPRPFEDSDIQRLAELGSAVYGPAHEVAQPDFLRWQYLQNPAGRTVTWLAVDRESGRLAGSYSVIPLQMRVGEVGVRGSLSLNTMTHPANQKQGVFSALAERTYGTCREQGIALTIGLPNPSSYPGFVGRLGFQDVGTRLVLAKPLRARRLFERRLPAPLALVAAGAAALPLAVAFRAQRARGASAVRVAPVARFDARFDALDAALDGRNRVVRSGAHLHWRYAGYQGRRYQAFAAWRDDTLLGYLVLRDASSPGTSDAPLRIAYVVDGLVAGDLGTAWSALFAAGERWARATGHDVLAVRALESMALARAARRAGLRPVPLRFRQSESALIVRRHAPESDALASLGDVARWHLTDGDNDTP